MELVEVSVLAEHVDDLCLGAGKEESELVRVGGKRGEVCGGIAPAEALCGGVVCASGVPFEVECAEPNALVFFVDLRAPAAVGLGNDAFVLGRGELSGFGG